MSEKTDKAQVDDVATDAELADNELNEVAGGGSSSGSMTIYQNNGQYGQANISSI